MAEKKNYRELAAMRFSLILSVLYVVADIAIAIICDSETILLDGLYGIADIVVACLAIFVISKINNPPNERYHFGYSKFEPFMTAIEGTLIAAVCFATITMSIQDIVHPEPVKHPNIIIWYSFINIFIGFGFGIYIRFLGKRTGSRIIDVDSELWLIGGFISLAVFVAFYISDFMTRLGFPWYAKYVDPAMAITLSLFFLQRPVEILKKSFYDLVDASPRGKIDLEVRKTIDACVKKYSLKGVKWLKLRRAGRKVFVSACFLTEPHKSLGDTTSLAKNISAEIKNQNENFDVSVFLES